MNVLIKQFANIISFNHSYTTIIICGEA